MGWGQGGNGLTQLSPYSQGINAHDSSVIKSMFANG